MNDSQLDDWMTEIKQWGEAERAALQQLQRLRRFTMATCALLLELLNVMIECLF